MYIAPNTNIRILNNVPLTNRYTHTIYFATEAAQRAYFLGKYKYVLTQYSYQRVNSNIMRVQYAAEDLYDCNYLMFQNASFGDKWFYAFITRVNYINNVTSEIEYEIDVMQTWAFDYTLLPSFVEREHARTDSPGDNTVPEQVGLGEYTNGAETTPYNLGDLQIVIAAPFDTNYSPYNGGEVGGTFSGLYFHRFMNTAQGISQAANFIAGAGTQAESIVAIFLMPWLVGSTFTTSYIESDYSYTKNYNLTRTNGDSPKNNKLFTYPYNFLRVETGTAQAADYAYEYFTGIGCNFKMCYSPSTNPAIALIPINYKGLAKNFGEAITLSGFPMLSFNTDTFKIYAAQMATNIGVNALSTAVNAGITGDVKTALSGAESIVNSGVELGVRSVIQQLAPQAGMPNVVHNGSGDQTLTLTGGLTFHFMPRHIRPEYVDIIDDYFSMYGYATNRVKIPNRNVRENWTYTKTIGCNIQGNMPQADLQTISNIYDKGLTFWRTPANVGNYTLSNNISIV